jgi:iron complex transport system permease protein
MAVAPLARPGLKSFQGLGLSFRFNVPVLGMCLIVLGLTIALGAWGMTMGSFPIPVQDVWKSVIGQGERQTDFIVMTLRFPRVLTAVLIGALLAMAGGVFQGLVRNPLVAPDIIGVNAGASLVAVAWIVTRQPVAWLPIVAFGGAVTAAGLIYALTWRGHISPSRLILVGLGINAMSAAGTTYLMVRFPIEQVSSALLWTTGTVYGADWGKVTVLATTLGLLAPLAIGLMWPLRILQLGDNTARSLGLPLERTRLAMLLIGCALASTAVSIGGAIGFVAFMVPHVARMLGGPMTGGVLLLCGLLGGLLLLGADLAGQFALPIGLPVGVVTAALGAPYFLFLLYRSNARL